MRKNKESLNEELSKYEKHFSEDIKAIDEELEKSKGYSDIIDNEIKKLTAPGMATNRGGQHYLIEHITNAVQLQTQRQSLRKDKFAIKKAILDYALKFADDDIGSDGTADYTAILQKLLDADKKEKTKDSTVILNEDVDSEIDRQLENDDEG